MATDYVVRFTGQDNLSGTINQVRNRLQEVGQATSQLDQIQQKFQKIEQGTAPLKRKLRDIKALMAEMNFNGLSNTALFNQMAQQAGAYADALGDATTATNVFANDNFKLEAMAQGLSGIAGAASVATGIMGLLGKENKEVAQAIMKVQSVLAVLNGVQAIANVLNKDSAFMLRLKQIRTLANTTATAGNTVATGANTVATVANTAAQNAWNVAKAVAKALLGDWTGLVLVGAVALGTYALATSNSTDEINEQTKATNKAKEAQNKYNADVASNTGNLIGKYQLLRNEWNNLKSAAEKTQWIKDNATEFRNLGLKVGDLKSAEDVFVNNTSNVVTALKARASAMAAQTMLTEAYTEYYKKIMQADNSVAGGGFYTPYTGRGAGWSTGNPNISDEMRAAGVTNSDFNQRTTTKRSGGMIYDTTEYQESQTVIDKVNAYRIRQAQATNRTIKQQAQADLDKTVTFATNKINEANDVISANGLDFNQGSGGNGGRGGNTEKPKTPVQQYRELAGAISDIQFAYDKGLIDKEAALAAIDTINEKIKALGAEPIELDLHIKSDSDIYRELQKQATEIQFKFDNGLITQAEADQAMADLNAKLEKGNKFKLKVKGVQAEPTRLEQYGKLTSAAGDIQSEYDAGLINKEEALSRIAQVNSKIAELGGKPVKLEFQTNFDEIVTNANAAFSAIQGIDGIVNSVENLTTSLKEGANAWDIFMNVVNIASSVISGISAAVEAYNIISTIFTAKKTAEGVATTTAATAITTAETAKASADLASIGPAVAATAAAKAQEAALLDLAAAGYFAAHASIPFAGFGIAAGFVSSMMAMMAAQTAASTAIAAFADGGIVGGSTYHGDRVLARVNAGEMVLNKNQQANLFNALNSGVGGGTTISEVRIKGSDLYLALKNYNSKMSKIK